MYIIVNDNEEATIDCVEQHFTHYYPVNIRLIIYHLCK